MAHRHPLFSNDSFSGATTFRLLLTTLLGILAGYMKILDAKTFVPHSTTFIFYAALPSLVLNALGIKIDLYDDKNLWEFISVFLILRAIALVVAFLAVAADSRKGVGQIAVLWLAMTWISTVILGVPISSAVFDNPQTGAKYGILAGISSFIFQLPLQLFFLECHQLEEEYLTERHPDNGAISDPELAQKVAPVEENQEAEIPDKSEVLAHQESLNEVIGMPRLSLWVKFASRRDIWLKILIKISRNPVLWAIAGGFFLTLSTLGPTYLNDKSDDFVPGLGWISETLFFIGNTVTPVSLFTMGIWMQDQGKGLFKMNPLVAVGCMVSKLILVPLVMVGLAKAFDMDDEPGRAAVLIAALPISMASFSLANRYGIGEALMAENVALGTLLILPTVILWNVIMDEVGLFPISK